MKTDLQFRGKGWNQFSKTLGEIPGLVVIKSGSQSEGRGFKSQHCMLDGHFSHQFAIKLVIFEKYQKGGISN